MNKLINKVICGDSFKVLSTFPDESIDCVVTSPPYWGLRDYGVKGQLGLEPTFEEYIGKLCGVFDVIKRVLKKEGTCWVNLGDTYSGSCQGAGKYTKERIENRRVENLGSSLNYLKKYGHALTSQPPSAKASVQKKSLCMIPFRFAIEICNRGWILRNTVIWHKPNCMPSSVKDRFTVDFEYLFFFVKNRKYWFETQYEPYKESTYLRVRYGGHSAKTAKGIHGGMTLKAQHEAFRKISQGQGLGRNKRCVWKISTKSFSEAHFAVYPPELIETPIKAGCPEFICNRCGKGRQEIFKGKSGAAFNIRVRDVKSKRIKHFDRRASQKEVVSYNEKKYGGEGRELVMLTDCGCKAGFVPGIVLDPFMGAGTTAATALNLGRRFVGIELNPEYVKMAEKRISQLSKRL